MDLDAMGGAARRAMYVLLSLQASACTLQDFDALDKGWGVSVGGDTGSPPLGQAGTPSEGGTGGTPGAGGTSTDVEPPPPDNLVANASFEAGHEGWIPFGMSTILDVSTGARTGEKCILSSGRSESWMGPSFPARALLTAGNSYLMVAWLRMVTTPDNVQLTLKTNCDATETYTPIAAVPVSTEWTKIEGVLRVPDCELAEVTPYFEGPAANSDFWVDDVSITLVD
jgi:hypothetical protein